MSILTVFFKTNKSFEIIYIGAINTTANAPINILSYLCVKKKVHFICANIVYINTYIRTPYKRATFSYFTVSRRF